MSENASSNVNGNVGKSVSDDLNSNIGGNNVYGSNADGEDANNNEKQFEFGPDCNNDLRQCRPYFLVPFPVEEAKIEETKIEEAKKQDGVTRYQNKLPADQEEVIGRIKKFVPRMAALRSEVHDDEPPITDVIIFSHGWRRNFYAAVTGYDRLVSRYARLLHAGRFDYGEIKPSIGAKFRPLILNFHWHSDAGEDEFVDLSGRRDKISFMNAITALFEPVPNSSATSVKMTRDFEDIFAYFSELAAPGTKALTGDHFDERGDFLIKRLDDYKLKTDSSPLPEIAKRAEKTAVAWTCYFEADTRQVLLDQDSPPQKFYEGFQAWDAISKFGTAILGPTAIVSAIYALVKNIFSSGFKRHAEQILAGLPAQFPRWIVSPTTILILYFVLSGFLGALILWIADLWKNRTHSDATRKRPSKGFPVLLLLAWFPWQVICAVPALLILGITFLFKGLKLLCPIYDERSEKYAKFRRGLGRLIDLPGSMLRRVIGTDTSVNGMLDQIAGVASFYEMQARAVETGKRAAKFLNELYEQVPELKNKRVRLHLLGHSFGGLVMANMTEELAKTYATTVENVQTLCLLQAAIGSGWFEGQDSLSSGYIKRLGCIYSVYDTANGVIYPIANASRIAAGAVGLTKVGTTLQPETRNKFVLLVKPPNLDSATYRPVGQPAPRAKNEAAILYNLDASRIIYNGNPATGGGHMDIYKDDVINLIWGLMFPRTDDQKGKTDAKVDREHAVVNSAGTPSKTDT